MKIEFVKKSSGNVSANIDGKLMLLPKNSRLEVSPDKQSVWIIEPNFVRKIVEIPISATISTLVEPAASPTVFSGDAVDLYYLLEGDFFFELAGAGGLSNYLGVLASSPVSGSAGDYYYNSVTAEFVAYDDVRAKWLSVASHTYQFQRTGDVTNGTPLQDGSVVMSVSGATARGIRTGFDATIVGIAVNRSNTDFTATIDVFADNNTGSPLLQVSFSPATDTDAVNNAANVDITATNVLGVRVTGGATAKVSFPTGYLTVKRKY